MAKPEDREPWIELEWKEPVAIRDITIVLDTGMHRRLTLTHDDNLHQQNVWGPQPETLKEFRILAYLEGSCEEGIQVMHVQDNYQRQVTCQVQLEQVRKLQLEVLGTNGLDHARILKFDVIEGGICQ